jgi:hypothetical protein
VIEGTLIAESLRVGTNLGNLKLTIRTIGRFRAQGTTPDQPGIWTTLDFAADETEAENLAQAFAGARLTRALPRPRRRATRRLQGVDAQRADAQRVDARTKRAYVLREPAQ